MGKQDKEQQSIRPIPPQILDLLLDVVLEVMRAKRGSIMLLNGTSQELTIRNSRGIKKEIIAKAGVRLGSGISGKVAASGQAVFVKGMNAESQLNIKPDDLVNPEIDTSYIVPIKLHDGTVGTINVNSVLKDHGIEPEKESLIRRILYCFSEYLVQVDLPPSHHETPSQLYMMNIFREYSSLRELRMVFDYIFHLITNRLKTRKKGVFLLKNRQSGFFDLILGYGLDTTSYREIYEELATQLQVKKIEAIQDVTVFRQEDLFSAPVALLREEFYIVMPLVWENTVQGQLFLFTDTAPALDETTQELIQSICESAARVIVESASEQRFQDLASTDSLTGMYNYGLWWKRLHEELARASRLKDSKLSLIVLDIDQFDRFNRDHGYFLGDEMLRVIADRINRCLRDYDIAGRIGGDEFAITLPNTDKQSALEVAQRILDTISGIPAEMKISLSHPLTLSGGVIQFPDDAATPGALVENAKAVLVSAKIMGGNRIKSFEHLEE
ncbi:MAG: sensor domain-containing diguanylate cyclase [Deltaproteobacteria bacterium]|nr:sensor domain-containing diguanylate cyclase [Deltaproteobacteria bacterium]